jgi:hypothetical protein
MQLTVTGASGTVNWAGETWNLPADSGVVKCVCPSVYTLDTTGPTTSEYWTFAGPVSQRLSMRRQFRSTSIQNLYQHVAVRSYRSSFTAFTYATYPYTTPAFSAATPTPNPALGQTGGAGIPDKYFLTFTQGGITYKVERGINW